MGLQEGPELKKMVKEKQAESEQYHWTVEEESSLSHYLTLGIVDKPAFLLL